jgi:hypothetical protein
MQVFAAIENCRICQPGTGFFFLISHKDAMHNDVPSLQGISMNCPSQMENMRVFRERYLNPILPARAGRGKLLG